MLQIESLSSLEGRSVLHDVFREFRYTKRMNTISTLALCWRICTKERELYRFADAEVTVLHPLGIFSGTGLWMEEIVNRFYFSTINSFVYFGAAILLVSVGFRRIYDDLPDSIVIGSVIFEALMLMFMFVVMFFSPTEEEAERSSENSTVEELVREVGEIARDYYFRALLNAYTGMRGEIKKFQIDPDAAAKQIKLRLDSEAAALADLGPNERGERRRAIVPGDLGRSELVRRITAADLQIKKFIFFANGIFNQRHPQGFFLFARGKCD